MKIGEVCYEYTCIKWSPRQNGNTAKMVTAFCEGAESSNHSVKTVNVCKLNVKGCLACEYCHSKGNGKCIQKDDMQDIYSLLKSSLLAHL